MWMLTDERKNELLKQRDTKLSELGILKAKTPESIWEADLEALEKKLDEVEEKERQVELGVNAKRSKQVAAKQTATGKRKRAAQKNDEIYPSHDGIKIEFKVTDEILKKYEKMAAAGARAKAKKEAGGGGGGEGGEVDEFDSLVNKVKKEPGWFEITQNVINKFYKSKFDSYFFQFSRKEGKGAKTSEGAKSAERAEG